MVSLEFAGCRPKPLKSMLRLGIGGYGGYEGKISSFVSC